MFHHKSPENFKILLATLRDSFLNFEIHKSLTVMKFVLAFFWIYREVEGISTGEARERLLKGVVATVL